MNIQKVKKHMHIIVIYFCLVYVFYWVEVTLLCTLAREGFLGSSFTSDYMSEEWLLSGPGVFAFLQRMKNKLKI